MTAMTVSDIQDRVKRTFGDESGVQVMDADILRWINDAQRECVMQHENLLQAKTTLAITAGTPEVTLPTDLYTLQSVYFNPFNTGQTFDDSGYFLKYVSMPTLETMGGAAADVSNKGNPSYYARSTNENLLRLYPTPDTSYTAGLQIVYSRYPVQLSSTASPLDLPEYYHIWVVEYCMMKAYEMDEDWESADKKAAYVQSTLDFNNNRESWFARDSYPVISISPEDI